MKMLFVTSLMAGGLLAGGLAGPGSGMSSASAAEGITIRTNTAGELAEACGVNPREPGADARINFCRGFAQGAIAVELKHAGEKKPFCFPNPSPSRAETMNQFVNWVRAVAGRRSSPSTDGLFTFLAERFPCK